MTTRLVLTAIGPDRPGLVAEVSEFVLERGGSIGESRMVNLHGQFAIAMLVSGNADEIERLAGDIELLRSQTGVDARLTPVVEAPAAPAPRAAYRLVATALDQPGLVHEVAAALRRLHANVESLDTGLDSAPMTGTPMFTMDIVFTLLSEVAYEDVEREVGSACELLNLTWTLSRERGAAAGEPAQGDLP